MVANIDPSAREVVLLQRRFAAIARRYCEQLEHRDPEALALLRLACIFRSGVTESQLLSVRAMETGMEIGLLRKVDKHLAAAAMLGMVRGVIEQLIRDPNPPAVDTVVNELLLVALRGVMA